MKILFIFISSLLLTQSQTFCEKVLDDFDSNSRFIFITVKSSEYNGAMIIQNDKFFYFLNQKMHLNKNDYKLFVEKKLKKNLVFNLGTTNLAKWSFIKVPKLKKVESNALKGIEKFIDLYFDTIDGNRVIKDGISEEERTSIIMILFRHQFSSYIDDETGYLLIG
jgi:hypothetical protein